MIPTFIMQSYNLKSFRINDDISSSFDHFRNSERDLMAMPRSDHCNLVLVTHSDFAGFFSC